MTLRTLCAALLLAAATQTTYAQSVGEPLSDLLSSQPGSAGLGGVTIYSRSPYRDGGTQRDLLPLYLYEGERLFLRSDRIGLKFALPAPGQVLEVFARRRLESHPQDDVPAALEGMAFRSSGMDLGLTWRMSGPWGQVHATALGDTAPARSPRTARRRRCSPARSMASAATRRRGKTAPARPSSASSTAR